MKNDTLKKKQKVVLRKASSNAVIETLSNLDKFYRRKLWLGKTNRYRTNTMERIKAHDRIGKYNKDLKEYIAVSTILHCFDGWIYLGRAIGALSSGDAHTSHHLAYYAELRAGMSLMASEGIGIFQNKHYVIKEDGQCILIPDGQNTHQFTWLSLSHWAGLLRSSLLLQEIITPSGIPLRTWLESFRSGINARLLGKEWLNTWGLDLKIVGHDREGRNEVSYRPNFLVYQQPINLFGASGFIKSFWQMFQPFGDSKFETLDRYLLRSSLRKIYMGITDQVPEQNINDYRNRIEKMIEIVDPTGIPHEFWISFLLDNQPSILLDIASKNESVALSNNHHFSVIARAALLLRVATGSLAKIIKTASISKEEISFWWETYSNDLGIIDLNSPIENVDDLWLDIEIALETISKWEDSHHDSEPSYSKWGQDLGKELKRLEECERVSLWGMGL